MEKSDRELIIEMVTIAFEQNPRAMAIVKKKNAARSVRLMTEYAYQLVEKFDGIYLSKDKSTVLFYYQKSRYRRSLVDYVRYGQMFMKAIRPSQLYPTLKREKFIANLRLPYDDYIYVWILGSDQSRTSIRGLADINQHLYELSERLQIPILIETTLEKLLKFYRYGGFEIYNEWHDKEADITVWFLQRELDNVKEARKSKKSD
ncbi:MAG: hypothetical protein GY790_23455 [Bacteroidetes bacterium]|nr:hypothetical protein [Bacteroidota bacterium]